MRATELIEKLQKMVAEGGDAEVVPTCDEDEDLEPLSRELASTSNPLRSDDGRILLYVTLGTLKENDDDANR